MPTVSNNDQEAVNRFRELCAQGAEIPLFNQAWWLDASSGADSWSVVLEEHEGRLIAALPFIKKRFLWVSYSDLPALSQSMGPWFDPAVQRSASYEKKRQITERLVKQLPQFGYFRQKFDFAFDDWMPFYWSGYQQVTFYSHILENIKDHSAVYAGFKSSLKTDLKKAEIRNKIRVIRTEDIDLFLDINRDVFTRQKRNPPYSNRVIKQIDKACRAHAARDIFVAVDAEKNAHAAVYIAYDFQRAHYLMGGARTNFRNSAALSLCLWEAIKHASVRVSSFNFEGSMMRPIEKFFRSFGGTPKPYFSITKSNLPGSEVMVRIARKLDARK